MCNKTRHWKRQASRNHRRELHEKKSLRGFFTATLPSGLVLHDLTLHERNGERWIGFPAREWINAKGEKQYTRFAEFASRAGATASAMPCWPRSTSTWSR
jgi:hypothetical protein